MKFAILSFFKNAGTAAPSSAYLYPGESVRATMPAPTTAVVLPEKPMSIITFFEGAEKSTAAWIAKELARIEREEPSIARVVDASLTYITPVLKIALAATGDPEAALVVGKVATQAEQDLTVASALVTDFGPTPTAATAFASVATNLSGLLTAGHVKSTTAVAAVTKAVNEVGVLATALQTAATAISASAVPAAPAPATA